MKRFAPHALAILICFTGCKKAGVALSPLGSLNFVNATVNLASAKVNFTNLKGLYSSTSTTTAYGGYTQYGINAGVTVPITVVSVADTNTAVFTGNFNFVNGSIYSLYLAGTTTAVDTVFALDNIPSHPDSSCGVRFINLSYNSSPIVITLASTPTVIEFNSLAYKQSSAFKTYPALATNGTYAFQVRDAITNNLLGSYTLTTPRFFNCTLVWKGMTGATGTNAPGIARVNNY